MAENKTFVDKTSFVFGLIAGIAIISVIILLSQSFNSKADDNKAAGEAIEEKTERFGSEAEPPHPLIETGASIKKYTELEKGKAKVEIVEYSDFECPFCLRHQESLKLAAEEYGKDIYVEYRHFPLNSLHPQAQKAAEASECAAEQGKFWEMHDKIYQAAGAKAMSVAKWKEYAKELSLDAEIFNSCLDGGKYAGKVGQDAAEGSRLGVQGTPATFINGQLVSGAVAYEQIKAVIDKEL